MPEAADDVTVKTRFASAQALMAVVAMGIERGALRLPATIAAGRTFQIALLTATGEVAVRGSAEAVRQEGGTTLVRFLSASDDGGDKDAWIDLDDAVVNVPAALMQPRGPLPDAPGRLRARARDRSDWAGALGTPLPPEPARPGTPPRRAIVPPLPTQARPAAAPAPASIPDIPPLQAESRAPQPARSAVDLPELAPVAVGSQRLPVPPPAPTPVRPAAPMVAPAPPSAVAPPSATAQVAPPSATAHVAPPIAAPPIAAPPSAAPPSAAPPSAAGPVAAGPAPLPTGTTLPPPLMAVFAAPGAGYYMAPAPAWPSEPGGEGRARPTTLPPGWGAEQGRMWIPVMDPAAMPMVAPPAVAAPTTAPAPVTTRAARGVLIASVVIATAGAAVAVSAVLWARSVSATRATPPAVAAAPTPAPPSAAPTAAPPVAAAPAPTPSPAPVAAVESAAPQPVAAAPAPTPPPPAPVAAVEPPPPPEPAAAAPPVAAIEPPPAAAPAAAPDDCRLAITTSADRVGIFVDGQKRGETPATIALPCAATTVVLRHPRYDEQVRHLDADAARGALHVIMTRPRAQLRIVTRPSGAIVQIDGRTVGRAPLTTTVDGFERARVTLSAPGMHTEDRRVYAKAGTTMVNVTLKKQ